MARKKRRQKIRKSQMKGRGRLEREFNSLKDPQTVVGQSLCSVEQLMAPEEREVALMRQEEELIPDSEVFGTPSCGPNDSAQDRAPYYYSRWIPSFLIGFF